MRFFCLLGVSSTAANFTDEADGILHAGSLCGDIETVDAGNFRFALSNVGRIFTTVVLPAPFEPNMAKMLLRATSKFTPCSTL